MPITREEFHKKYSDEYIRGFGEIDMNEVGNRLAFLQKLLKGVPGAGAISGQPSIAPIPNENPAAAEVVNERIKNNIVMRQAVNQYIQARKQRGLPVSQSVIDTGNALKEDAENIIDTGIQYIPQEVLNQGASRDDLFLRGNQDTQLARGQQLEAVQRNLSTTAPTREGTTQEEREKRIQERLQPIVRGTLGSVGASKPVEAALRSGLSGEELSKIHSTAAQTPMSPEIARQVARNDALLRQTAQPTPTPTMGPAAIVAPVVAGIAGAKNIYGTGKKLNQEIESNREQTSSMQDRILELLRTRRRNRNQ